MDKLLYNAQAAQKMYEERLVNKKEPTCLTPEAFNLLDELVMEGFENGQSLYHIVNTNKDLISVTSRTVYNYVDNGLLKAKRHNRPTGLKVYDDRRKGLKYDSDRDIGVSRYENRKYKDFTLFARKLSAGETFRLWQLDTVEGIAGDKKCFLTLLNEHSGLIIITLLPEQTIACVNKALHNICDLLGEDLFQKIFVAILTDRGHEFYDPEGIEHSSGGKKVTRLFYCNPLASYQKAEIENCHRMLRRIFPKHSSTEGLKPHQAKLMSEHINSYARDSKDGLSAFEALSKYLMRQNMRPLCLSLVSKRFQVRILS
jgi:IS30 family transposase